jgi:hypothetical protein
MAWIINWHQMNSLDGLFRRRGKTRVCRAFPKRRQQYTHAIRVLALRAPRHSRLCRFLRYLEQSPEDVRQQHRSRRQRDCCRFSCSGCRNGDNRRIKLVWTQAPHLACSSRTNTGRLTQRLCLNVRPDPGCVLVPKIMAQESPS